MTEMICVYFCMRFSRFTCLDGYILCTIFVIGLVSIFFYSDEEDEKQNGQCEFDIPI